MSAFHRDCKGEYAAIEAVHANTGAGKARDDQSVNPAILFFRWISICETIERLSLRMAYTDVLVEQRLFERVDIAAPAKIFLRGREFAAKTLNISLSGVALKSQERPQIKEEILIYINNVIRLRGVVARLFRGGFAIQFFTSERSKNKIANLIAGKTNFSGDKRMPEHRRFQRVKPKRDAVVCVVENGERHECIVSNFSIVGAAVTTNLRPPIGSKVTLGNIPCTVVRFTKTGFAVEFPDYWKSMRPHQHGCVTH